MVYFQNQLHKEREFIFKFREFIFDLAGDLPFESSAASHSAFRKSANKTTKE